MKRSVSVAVLGLLLWTGALAGNAYSDDPRFTDEKLQATEKSLVQALESGNFGVQTSAAQVVRDLKGLVPRYEFSSLVIPLMRIVKDEDAKPASRILAALALHELGSARGDFAIKRTAEFTDAKQVKYVCLWLSFERTIARRQERDSIANIASRTR